MNSSIRQINENSITAQQKIIYANSGSILGEMLAKIGQIQVQPSAITKSIALINLFNDNLQYDFIGALLMRCICKLSLLKFQNRLYDHILGSENYTLEQYQDAPNQECAKLIAEGLRINVNIYSIESYQLKLDSYFVEHNRANLQAFPTINLLFYQGCYLILYSI